MKLLKNLLPAIVLISCCALLSVPNTLHAQTEDAPKMGNFILHIDGGTLFIASSATFNFEGRFVSSNSGKVHLYGRTGIGYVHVVDLINFSEDDDDPLHFYGPHGGLTMLAGKGHHYFELSSGVYVGFTKSPGGKNPAVAPLIDAGYRWQKPGSGFLFRAKAGFLGVGVGFGYSF
jgi:hypothetical protein